MTIYSTFSWTLILNCSTENRERKGWQQCFFEVNFKHPFIFKRTIKYYGEKKERGIDRKTGKQVEIDVWDDKPRLISSENDRLIEKIYNLPLIVLTTYSNTKLGGQRNREMREYFQRESEREQ